MKYCSPFGSVAVRMEVSNGTLSCRLIGCGRAGGCATSTAVVVTAMATAASDVGGRRFVIIMMAALAESTLLIGGLAGCGRVGILALGRFPVDAARVLHEPRDLFGIANPLMVRLAEAVRLAGEADEPRRDAAILQPLVIHHALADRIGRVALAMQQQRRRGDRRDVGVRRLLAITLGALPRRAADIPEPHVVVEAHRVL